MPHAGSQDGVGLDAVVSRFVVVDEAGSPAWAVGLRTLGRPRSLLKLADPDRLVVQEGV